MSAMSAMNTFPFYVHVSGYKSMSLGVVRSVLGFESTYGYRYLWVADDLGKLFVVSFDGVTVCGGSTCVLATCAVRTAYEGASTRARDTV